MFSVTERAPTRDNEDVTVNGMTAISDREAEVLVALRARLTNAEIARQLHISIRTVESHVSSLLRKLGALDRRELADLPAFDTTPAGNEVLGVPLSWTSFIGRTTEVAVLAGFLETGRLVTIVGPGGVGKTRLSTEAAFRVVDRFPDGGAFVDLVPVRSEFVVQSVAAAFGVNERPPEPLEQTVLDRLATKRCLLLFDNCEHLLEAAGAFIALVLARCPGVVVLATSRERFGIDGEQVLQLRPLGVKATGEGESEAAQLFRDRCGTGDSSEDAVLIEEICRELDGIPLAIELAAARSASLGLDGLLAGLADRLRLLARPASAGERHGSVRSVIEWSHHLLDDEESHLWRRLSVFAGSFDLAAAIAIAGEEDVAATTDLLGRLSDKSLLERVRHPGPSRWRFLESMRAFGRERLAESGEEPVIEERYLRWASATARALEAELDHDALGGDERFDTVAGDLRRALAGSSAGAGDGADYALALSLAHLCYARRFLAEGRAHLRDAIERAPDDATKADALRALAWASFAEMRGESYQQLLRAADHDVAAGDTYRAASTIADAAMIAGRCPAIVEDGPNRAGIVEMIAGARELVSSPDLELLARFAVADVWSLAFGQDKRNTPDWGDEALGLARQLDNPILLSAALDAATVAAQDFGRIRVANTLAFERVALLDRMIRHDARYGGEVIDTFHMATETAVGIGDLVAAIEVGRRSVDDPLSTGLPHISAAHLIVPLALAGEFDEVLDLGGVMLDGWQRAGSPKSGWMKPSFLAPALVYGLRGDDIGFARWWRHARELSVRSYHETMYVFDRVALHTGLRLFPPTLGSRESGFDMLTPYEAATACEFAVATGQDGAVDLYEQACSLGMENSFTAAQLARVRWRLNGNIAGLEEAAAGFEHVGARFELACTLALTPGRTDEGRANLLDLGCAAPIS